MSASCCADAPIEASAPPQCAHKVLEALTGKVAALEVELINLHNENAAYRAALKVLLTNMGVSTAGLATI